MTTCAVSTCENNRRKTDNGSLKVVYHRFPKDNGFRQKWIQLCKRGDNINFVNAKICSIHFKETDYKRDFGNELLGWEPKKELKDDAIPSLYLPHEFQVPAVNRSQLLELTNVMKPSPQTTTVNSRIVRNSRKDRCHWREVRKRALQRLATLSPKKDNNTLVEDKNDTITLKDTNNVVCQTATKPDDAGINDKESRQINKPEGVDTSPKVNALTLRIQEHQAQVRALIAEKREVTERLNKCIQTLKARVKVSESEVKSQVDSRVRDILLKVFTRKQIKCLIDGKVKAKWQEEDIRRAMALRTISKKAYIYMRKTIGFPLPGLATLRRWSKSSQGNPKVVYKALSSAVPLTQIDADSNNTCVIAFDVLNVDVNDESDDEEL